MNCPYNIGGTRLSGPFFPEGRFPEGPACQVRRSTFDHPSLISGTMSVPSG
ncbi:hypothetical protein THTE_0578 [Thermogutta terrifontis]|uniref:Uncharacterized protein n=1 Tax=Thermogutta terrifontis TaxID=1331910 RepID=A0A286RB36_9BACT|nr:hypothetical protein THTE_0578 [Thermogutta terrifontis]